MRTSYRSIWVATALALSMSGRLTAATDPGASEDVFEQITITVQRRVENAQDVPIALKGSELEGKGVTQLADLQYATLSLSVGTNGLANAVNIRGIGVASGNPNVGNGRTSGWWRRLAPGTGHRSKSPAPARVETTATTTTVLPDSSGLACVIAFEFKGARCDYDSRLST